jgi:SAM-dependent methyltransferase
VSAIDPLARAGFGRGSEDYERGRPGYAPAAIDWLAARARIEPGRRVLDLAAGTGKLTRALVALGAEVVAVEPVPEMRRRLEHALPTVLALDGVAEALPLEAGSFDAVVCGEGFHWFDGPRALAEIHRVLRPHGSLGLLWNVHEWDRSASWVQAVERIIAPHSDGRSGTRYLSGRWRDAFAATTLFGPLETCSHEHELSLDRAGFVAQIASVAFIAALPDRERDGVLAQVERVLATDPALRDRQMIGVPYRTDAWFALRRTGV